MKLKYRADIDGLRAIAVLAVLFFHTDVPGFTGGFVGVDVFFVISGYLITSIILKEIKAENFSIARFYERRIRRIFPALFPVIAFVIVAGAFLFDTNAFNELGESIAATTLFSSNILFWSESGYFSAPSLQKPLLHTWSLAVEEQFYIFFPLALMAIHRYLKGKYFLWIMIAFIISLAASIYGVEHHPEATFYLVPTRGWELISGSILSLRALPNHTKSWQKNLLTSAGLALIFVSIFSYSEATPFPGAAALMPVIGAALIILSGSGGGTYAAQKILSARPLVFIGLISYSLYLWHWPLVALWKYLTFRPWNLVDSLGIIAASFVLSILSWKYIEQPFRGERMLLSERKLLFSFAGGVLIVFAGIGGVIVFQNGMSWRFPNTLNDTIYKADTGWENEHVFKNLIDQYDNEDILNIKPLIIGEATASPSYVVWGDSHSYAIKNGIAFASKHYNLSGFITNYTCCPPLLDVEIVDTPQDEVMANKKTLAFIDTHQELKTVILVARWAWYAHGEGYKAESGGFKLAANGSYDESNLKIVKTGLTKTVKKLLSMDRKVILVSDVPEIGYLVPNLYFKIMQYPEIADAKDVLPTIQEYNIRQRDVQSILSELAELPGVTLIHPESLMFDKNERVKIIANDELLYRDDDHLSTAGALYVAPVFDEIFKEMASNQSAAQKISAN